MIMKSDFNKLVCILFSHLSSIRLENFKDLIIPDILGLIKLHTYKFGLVYIILKAKSILTLYVTEHIDFMQIKYCNEFPACLVNRNVWCIDMCMFGASTSRMHKQVHVWCIDKFDVSTRACLVHRQV